MIIKGYDITSNVYQLWNDSVYLATLLRKNELLIINFRSFPQIEFSVFPHIIAILIERSTLALKLM